MTFTIFNAVLFILLLVSVILSWGEEIEFKGAGLNNRDSAKSMLFKIAFGVLIFWFFVVGIAYCVNDLFNLIKSLVNHFL